MGQVFQTFELLRMTALLNLLTNGLRLLAVGTMTALVAHASAQEWALASVFISLLAAIGGFLAVTRRYGLPIFSN